MVTSTSPQRTTEDSVANSLGRYVQEQMGLLGWSRETLIERTGLDRGDVDTILEEPVLRQWPEPTVLQSLATTLDVAVREIVLHTARACGLDVDAKPQTAEPVRQLGNEALMREVRRRLALGAAAGGYLSTHSPYVVADSRVSG
jgi:hypothetical protein